MESINCCSFVTAGCCCRWIQDLCACVCAGNANRLFIRDYPLARLNKFGDCSTDPHYHRHRHHHHQLIYTTTMSLAAIIQLFSAKKEEERIVLLMMGVEDATSPKLQQLECKKSTSTHVPVIRTRNSSIKNITSSMVLPHAHTATEVTHTHCCWKISSFDPVIYSLPSRSKSLVCVCPGNPGLCVCVCDRSCLHFVCVSERREFAQECHKLATDSLQPPPPPASVRHVTKKVFALVTFALTFLLFFCFLKF